MIAVAESPVPDASIWPRLMDLLDRAVMGFVNHVPGWCVAVAAMVFYPCLGLLAPVALNWSLAQLVAANVIGVSFAAVITIGWFSAQVLAASRRHLVDWTTNLRLLNAEEFEWLVGEGYRREGWDVRETGHQDSPDGNVDLQMKRDGVQTIVQCKRWESWPVSVDQIRIFGGTLRGKDLPRGAGIFVTLSDFNQFARAEADKMGITLVDGPELYRKVEKVRRPTLCDICRAPMLLGRSQHGWWFRCLTPGCKGKLDLGNEPGRAVELLTEPRASLS